MSVINGCGNNVITVQALDIGRSSGNELCRAFRDAPQDFLGVRTECQSSQEIPECFFVAPALLNAPGRYTESCGYHKVVQ